MISNSLLALMVLATLTLADPIPQVTTPFSSASTDSSGLTPAEEASLSSAEAAESSSLAFEESLIAGMPTLPASVESVLVTAIPTSDYTTGQPCQTTTPAWYYSLPPDVQSALSSYEVEFASWYSLHSSDLAMTVTLPDNVCAGTIFISGTSTATAAGKATATGTSAKVTGTKSVSVSVSASVTGNGSAAATSSSKAGAGAGAPGPTGVGASLVGLMGIVGLIVAL